MTPQVDIEVTLEDTYRSAKRLADLVERHGSMGTGARVYELAAVVERIKRAMKVRVAV